MLSATHFDNSVTGIKGACLCLSTPVHLNIKLENQKNEKTYFLDDYWLWGSPAVDLLCTGIRN